MKPPTTIYLQWLDDDGEEAEEVTWCVDRINDTDIEYRIVVPSTVTIEQLLETLPMSDV